jgi:hypothetical protein
MHAAEESAAKRDEGCDPELFEGTIQVSPVEAAESMPVGDHIVGQRRQFGGPAGPRSERSGRKPVFR